MRPATLDDTSFCEAASAITGAMRAHDTTWSQLLKLLASSSQRLFPQFIADAVAPDASIPATLALDLRIERLLLEHFTSGSYRVDGSEAVPTRRLA